MKIFLYIFLFSILLSSSGCHTTKFIVEEPEDARVNKDESITIDSMLLKNDTVISLVGFDTKYYEKYKNFEKVFVCTFTPKGDANQLFYVDRKKEVIIIPFKDVKRIFAVNQKFDVIGTAILFGGIILTVFILLIIIIGSAFGHGFKIG